MRDGCLYTILVSCVSVCIILPNKALKRGSGGKVIEGQCVFCMHKNSDSVPPILSYKNRKHLCWRIWTSSLRQAGKEIKH